VRSCPFASPRAFTRMSATNAAVEDAMAGDGVPSAAPVPCIAPITAPRPSQLHVASPAASACAVSLPVVPGAAAGVSSGERADSAGENTAATARAAAPTGALRSGVPYASPVCSGAGPTAGGQAGGPTVASAEGLAQGPGAYGDSFSEVLPMASPSCTTKHYYIGDEPKETGDANSLVTVACVGQPVATVAMSPRAVLAPPLSVPTNRGQDAPMIGRFTVFTPDRAAEDTTPRPLDSHRGGASGGSDTAAAIPSDDTGAEPIGPNSPPPPSTGPSTSPRPSEGSVGTRVQRLGRFTIIPATSSTDINDNATDFDSSTTADSEFLCAERPDGFGVRLLDLDFPAVLEMHKEIGMLFERMRAQVFRALGGQASGAGDGAEAPQAPVGPSPPVVTPSGALAAHQMQPGQGLPPASAPLVSPSAQQLQVSRLAATGRASTGTAAIPRTSVGGGSSGSGSAPEAGPVAAAAALAAAATAVAAEPGARPRHDEVINLWAALGEPLHHETKRNRFLEEENKKLKREIVLRERELQELLELQRRAHVHRFPSESLSSAPPARSSSETSTGTSTPTGGPSSGMAVLAAASTAATAPAASIHPAAGVPLAPGVATLVAPAPLALSSSASPVPSGSSSLVSQGTTVAMASVPHGTLGSSLVATAAANSSSAPALLVSAVCSASSAPTAQSGASSGAFTVVSARTASTLAVGATAAQEGAAVGGTGAAQAIGATPPTSAQAPSASPVVGGRPEGASFGPSSRYSAQSSGSPPRSSSSTAQAALEGAMLKAASSLGSGGSNSGGGGTQLFPQAAQGYRQMDSEQILRIPHSQSLPQLTQQCPLGMEHNSRMEGCSPDVQCYGPPETYRSWRMQGMTNASRSERPPACAETLADRLLDPC